MHLIWMLCVYVCVCQDRHGFRLGLWGAGYLRYRSTTWEFTPQSEATFAAFSCAAAWVVCFQLPFPFARALFSMLLLNVCIWGHVSILPSFLMLLVHLWVFLTFTTEVGGAQIRSRLYERKRTCRILITLFTIFKKCCSLSIHSKHGRC